MINKAGIEVQSKRQKEREEEIKLPILPQSWGRLCSLPACPQVQPATEDITARLVLPSVKTTSSSVLYKQQKLQKISRLLPSATRISHSWELRDQRQQRRNILFLSYFISALLISFSSHTSPLLLEVLMTSCTLSTSISGSRSLLASKVYKQHCKDSFSSISKQAIGIIPSPHCLNLLRKWGLKIPLAISSICSGAECNNFPHLHYLFQYIIQSGQTFKGTWHWPISLSQCSWDSYY